MLTLVFTQIELTRPMLNPNFIIDPEQKEAAITELENAFAQI